jgi:hypothetical protein
MVDAAALKPRARRRVAMTDGNVIEEELLVFERAVRHRYRWVNRPAAPFSLLVRGGEGDWIFARAGDGTRIVWTYEFKLTTPFVYPLAAAMLFFFRRWMEQGLARLGSLLTNSAGASESR